MQIINRLKWVAVLGCYQTWNVLFLKQSACRRFGIEPDSYCLVAIDGDFEAVLCEDSSLVECNLKESSKVEIRLRNLKNSLYVFCYQCRDIRAAYLDFICDICGQSRFRPITNDVHFRSGLGKCYNIGCQSKRCHINFLCSLSRIHEPVVVLTQLERNLLKLPCTACTSSESEVIVIFCKEKMHILCLSCFREYANEYLTSGLFTLREDFGYTLGCPAGCPDSFITDPHHFRILGDAFYSRYKEMAAARYVINKNTVTCPSCMTDWEVPSNIGDDPVLYSWYNCVPPGGCGKLFCSQCGWYIRDTNADDRNVQSTECYCQSQPTRPITRVARAYQQSRVWRLLNMDRNSSSSLALISHLCRPCPRCSAPTEKAGGCNHIHCRQCQSDWCWICCDFWSEDCQSLHWL